MLSYIWQAITLGELHQKCLPNSDLADHVASLAAKLRKESKVQGLVPFVPAERFVPNWIADVRFSKHTHEYKLSDS